MHKVSLTLLGTAVAYMLLMSFAVAVPADEFTRANKQFENKQYDSAIVSYNAILSQGVESAPIHFNLANAHFKKGDLGYAVLNYLRAQRLDPSDDDIRSNLEFAKRFTTVQLEGTTLNPISSLFESLTTSWRLNTLAWLSSILFILIIALLAVRYGLGVTLPFGKPVFVLVLLLLIASSYLTTFKYRHDYLARRAVIITPQSEVRSGPSQQSDLELQGEPGLVVEILSESGGYYNVLFENQRRGWIRKEAVTVI